HTGSLWSRPFSSGWRLRGDRHRGGRRSWLCDLHPASRWWWYGDTEGPSASVVRGRHRSFLRRGRHRHHLDARSSDRREPRLHGTDLPGLPGRTGPARQGLRRTGSRADHTHDPGCLGRVLLWIRSHLRTDTKTPVSHSSSSAHFSLMSCDTSPPILFASMTCLIRRRIQNETNSADCSAAARGAVDDRVPAA